MTAPGRNGTTRSGICPCGVVDDLDDRGYCSVCAAAPHDRECICDECDDYWTAIQEGVDPKTWRRTL